MERISTSISLLQGLFMMSTQFVKPRDDKCLVQTMNKSYQFVRTVTGLVMVVLSSAMLFKAISTTVSFRTYHLMMLALSTIAMTCSLLDRQCLQPWILYEHIAHFAFVILISYSALVAKNPNQNQNQKFPSYEEYSSKKRL